MYVYFCVYIYIQVSADLLQLIEWNSSYPAYCLYSISRLTVVCWFLQRHADPLLLNSKAESALDLAAQYGHIDSVELLMSHCPEMLYIQRPQFSPLHLAARNGHTVVTLSLINAGISVNTVVSVAVCVRCERWRLCVVWESVLNFRNELTKTPSFSSVTVVLPSMKQQCLARKILWSCSWTKEWILTSRMPVAKQY